MDTKRNYGAFFALMREMPHADKAEIIRQFTEGRTSSLREMTDAQYEQMIQALREEVQQQAKLRKARSEALHQIQLYGINTTDWNKVNNFCLQKRITGKTFRHLTLKDLELLTLKMRAINAKGKPKRAVYFPKHLIGEA